MSNETSNKTVQLTDEQEAFVASDKRVTVALAGPGSGKTTTIKEMVRRFPLSITRGLVLLSFTREAASRLKKGLESKELVYAGTTHSWMLRQIRRYGKLIDIPTNLAPIDEDASVDLIKATAEELRFNGELKGLMKACEENPMVTLERDKHPLISSEQWRVAHLYNRRLIEKGLIDYPGMLTWGRKLLSAGVITDGPKFLIVDEAQDSSKIEWDIYAAHKCERIWIVADIDQSVYAWRNARPEILNKRCQMPDTAVYTITRNYRSGPAICDAATRLIDCNHQRVNKPVVAADPEKPSSVEHWEFKDIEAETAAMLEWAKEDLDRAVICRSNKQVSHFKRALVEGGIKVVGRGAKPEDFNEFTAFIGVLGNPQNDTVANTFAIRHLGSKQAKTLRQRSEATCISLTDLLCEEIDWLHEMIQRAQIVSSMPELVELCARGYSKATLDIFRQCAEGSDSVDDLLVAIEEGVEDKKQEGVWVGTIHRAKGLEWGSVWLPQWCEQLFPFRANDIQEEDRRLAFVGITRGKDSVVTSSTKKSLVGFNAKPMSTGPSVFVSEAGIPIFEA